MGTYGSSIRQIFADDGGNLSSMRVLSALVVIIVLGTWSTYCLRNNVIVGFDVADISLILGALGAKAIQKKYEKNGQEK